jgi:hypothetical protein
MHISHRFGARGSYERMSFDSNENTAETKLRLFIILKVITIKTHTETCSSKGHFITGVLILADAVISISFNRGIPRVTFRSPLPAR